MQINKSPKLVALGAGVASIAVMLGGTTLSQITSASAASSTTSAVSTLGQTGAGQSDTDRQARQDAYLAKLAANLGVDVAKLKAAIKQTNLDQVAQLLSDGTITQAQADEMKTRIESGDATFGIGGPRGGHDGGGPGMGRGVDQAALASFLGIDTATLRSEQQAGKSLATIATDHGKSRDALKAFLTDAEKTEVTTAVTEGKMTQTEADAHLKQFTDNLDAMIDGTGGPAGGHGPMGGRSAGGPNGSQGTANSGASTTQG